VTKTKTKCPECGKQAALRADGTLNKHGYRNNKQEQASYRPKPCGGSGKRIAFAQSQ
jgi:predicted RNA-binding Zn-ribbon protein involved in translation (DUF1610 family)